MTNERAVEILNLDLDILGQYGCETAEAYKMAIQALEAQPTDAVSREAVIKNIKGWFDKIELNPDILIDSIVTLPSVTPRINLALTSQDCISREEVQDLISRWLSDYLLDETREALETINYKVGDMPSVTPRRDLAETSQDCIRRQAVIILIDEASEMHPYKVVGDSDTYSNYNQGWSDACDWLYANIEGVPSVKPTSEDIKEAYLKGYDYGVKDWFRSKTQPCEDCISRQKALDCFEQTNTRQGAKYAIETLPSVTPQRPKGKWIEDTQTGFKIRCSECGARNFGADRAYCPRCGRQMGGADETN